MACCLLWRNIMSTALEKNRSSRPYTAGKLLGIKVANNLKMVQKIESGLPFGTFERLGRVTGLPLDRLRVAVRITPRTLTRRKNENKLSPEESDRLVSVSRLLAQAFELFEGNKAAAVRWFTSPNRALGMKIPLEVAATEVGAREVEDLIGRLEHGVFS